MFNNLEAEQARKGLTNQDIANYLEISRQSYEIKKKNGNFKYSEITKLLDLFTVSFEYLFAKDEIA
jgi:DNA-binding XRE family transcriptional regulator|nr:MAG TPA: SOS-response transcriptional repressor [Caudoviricetes sp.]